MKNLQKIIIPDSVRRVDSYSFCFCFNLTSISFPTNISILQPRMFYECHRLQHIKLPPYLRKIGDECFFKCVLPGEIIRFLISFVCLGHQSQIGGRFSILACFLYENTYLLATKRSIPVRHDLEFIPSDFFVFALWYLMYVAVYGVFIGFLYRLLWQRERANKGDDRILHDLTENTKEG